MQAKPALLVLAALAAGLAPAAASATCPGGAGIGVVTITPPDVAVVGEPAIVQVTIKNTGSVTLANVPLGIYLSPDSAISQFDRKAGELRTPSVAPTATLVVSGTVTIPANLAPRNYYFGVVADPANTLCEDTSALLDNVRGAGDPTSVQAPAADLAALQVRWPARAAAGEVVPVEVVVGNHGVLDAEASIGFFLSTNDGITRRDPYVGTQRVLVPAGAETTQLAWVRLPAGIAPSSYYMGAWIDPDAEIVELRIDNNVAVSLPATVTGASLAVDTTWLPDALVGVPYVRSLNANGADSTTAWSLAGGALPAGVTVGTDGLVSGTPTEAGIFTPVFRVTSGARTADALLVFRVYAAASPLDVATTELPVAVLNADYVYPLAAAGGTPPYAWTVVGGAIAPGLSLGADGIVSGRPGAATNVVFTVELRDLSGTAVRRDLKLRIVERGELAIRDTAPDLARVGESYLWRFDATLASDLTWTLDSGRVPPGLALAFDESGATLAGTPVTAGLFTFGLHVQHPTGQVDRRTIAFAVAERALVVLTSELPPAVQGADYEAALTADASGVTWSLAQGELPPGLTLGAEGRISGTVDAHAKPGAFPLVFQAVDGSGASGRAIVALRVVEVPLEFGGGCGSAAPAAPALLLLVLVLARRRRTAALLAALAVLVSPLAASATGPVQEYFPVVVDEPVFPTLLNEGGIREPLPLSARCSSPRDDCTVPHAIPFDFPFYGTTYRDIRISTNGVIVFGTGANDSWAGNDPIPDSSSPNGFIAAWWDDLYLPTPPSDPASPNPNDSWLFYAESGTAPDRWVAIEWHRFTSFGGPSNKRPYSMQVRLHENGTITLHYDVPPATNPAGGTYGDPSFEAVVGTEDQAGASGGDALVCSPSCGPTEWPAGKRVILSRSVELAAGVATGPALARAETPARFSFRFSNRGSEAATGVVARLLLSSDKLLDANDVLLGASAPVDLGRGDEVQVVLEDVVIPAGTQPGPYWLIVQVDPDDAIPESTEADNVLESGPIRIASPAPDFAPTSLVLGVTRGAPGDEVPFVLQVENTGSRPGEPVWRVIASRNEFLSLTDRTLARGTVRLNAASEETIDASFEIPEDLPPGVWTIGALLNAPDDPDEAIPEIDPFDDSIVAGDGTDSQVLIVTGPLGIATAALPPAARGASYAFQLRASGGDGTLLWGINGAARPPRGLELRANGSLEGVPAVAGSSTFTVRVIGNGNQTVEKSFTLVVAEPTVALSFATHALPATVAGVEFETRLTAQGGTPPYHFTSAPGALPAGVLLTDDGRIGGVPRFAGDTPLTLTVTDSVGATARGALLLRVLNPQVPSIVSVPLADAVLDTDYSVAFTALGGQPALTWSLAGVRRHHEGLAQPFESLDQVPGLTLDAAGTLAGSPREVGTYLVDVRVTDARGSFDEDTFLLVVAASRGIAIVTESLPSAIVGVAYEARLHATGDESTHAYDAPDRNHAPPAGLTLGFDGRLTGVPEQLGTYAFIVRVTDQSGRTDVRAVAIDILPPEAAPASCASAAGLGLPALLGLLLVRRRRRAGLAALGLALAATACTPRVFDNCEAVTCQAGETCDPADGTCICGDVDTGRACSDREYCDAASGKCLLLDRCDLVTCGHGESCDPADGLCKCGTAACDAGETCTGTPPRCVVSDLCANVSCFPGEGCDPTDGLCKCGGAGGSVCPSGQACVDGTCSGGPCTSLFCTGGSVCDPGTETCRCGTATGDQCLFGQTCLPTEGKCLASTRCAAVRCSGGSSCDPADGKCRCGGPDGPECASGQTCDLANKRCVGGNLCFGRTCPANSVCEPEDGDCHCGSVTGPVCDNGRVCQVAGGTPVCREVCDPVTQTPCANGLSCTYNVATRLGSCSTAGTKGEGATCTASTDCARGMHCVAAGFSGTGTCRVYCARPGGTCATPNRTCKGFTSAPADLGACQP